MPENHGPYFPGQTQHPCGCYYPDIMRIKDDPMPNGGTRRSYHCVNHGSIVVDHPEIPYAQVIAPPVTHLTLDHLESIRKSERRRLHQLPRG